MDQLDNTQAVETPIESAPQAVEAAPVVEATQVPAEAQKPVESPYTPNWKYKANDQELELPEDYRAYIKSQEDEKKIKRLFEQVGGVESLKNNFKTTKTELDSYKKGIDAVNKLVTGGDFMKAFQVLGWDKKMAYQAAKQFLDFDELPQQQQQVHTQAWELEKHNQSLYENYQALQTQIQQQSAQLKAVELSNELRNPEIKSLADKYDQTRSPGKPSFRDEVIRYAHAESLRRGEDISAKEAVEAILGFIKPFHSQAAPMQQEPKELPVIPATKGSSSAASKTFKSLDDLKNYRKQQFGY